MRCIIKLSMLIGLALGVMAGSAAAQATRTWVSGVGNDADPCSRTAPCKTFAGAIAKTLAGGEINCIDQGAYGTVTITTSITIDCVGVTAGALSSGSNGVIINGSPTDVVLLRGLDINGAPPVPAMAGLNGIKVVVAGALIVEDCSIRGFKSAAPNGRGIEIVTTNNFTFLVSRSRIHNNGTGVTGAGIEVLQTVGTVREVINDTEIVDNAFGVAVNGTANPSGANVTIQGSTIANNAQVGVVAVSSGTPTSIMIKDSVVSNNLTGLQTVGAGTTLRVGSSQMTGNTNGVVSTVLSYGNNQLNGNGTDGTLTLIPGGLH